MKNCLKTRLVHYIASALWR